MSPLPMNVVRRRPFRAPPVAGAALAALCLLASCGDAKDPKLAGGGAVDVPRAGGAADPEGSGAGGTTAPAPSGAGPGPAGTAAGSAPVRRKPVDLTVPPGTMPTAAQARATIDAALRDAVSRPDLAEQALGYLVALGDAGAVRDAVKAMLAPGQDTGGYADRDLAAVGLAALIRVGDADAATKALALAKALLDEKTSTEALLPALAMVKGPRRSEALGLLARFTDDFMVREEALIALASARAPEGAAALAKAADGKDETDLARAAAVSGLLAAGAADASVATLAADAAERLAVAAAADATSDVAVAGLAAAEDPSALPWIRRIVADSMKDGDELAAVQIAAAARGLVDIRGWGQARDDDRAWLRSLLGKDDGDADPDVRTALWALGDDAEAPGAAEVLERTLGGIRHGFDEQPAIEVLEVLAFRRQADVPAFEKLVASAASLTPEPSEKRTDVAERAARVRLAAAWAVLATSRR